MSEQTPEQADDPYGGRAPTSHERRAGEPWDASYHAGPAPWDIEQPQPAIRRLADAGGAFGGAVLDAGCGSGENALHLAERGLEVVGFDVAETAIARAREKAARRGLDAEFVVADALDLSLPGSPFASVLDCGLFHAFDGDERRRYLASLASVTDRGSALHLLCFSDVGETIGPHPVSERDLRTPFEESEAWEVRSVDPDRCLTRFQPDGVSAWLAQVARI